MPDNPRNDLTRYEMSTERGFLPPADPERNLAAEFSPWEQIADDLPKLLVSDRLRHTLDNLPVLNPSPLLNPRQLKRAMLALSYMAHAYVWGSSKPADRLPASIAIPFHQLATKLGRPPVLSYASYALDNWRRIDPTGPIQLGNIALIQNFLGGVDEEWFILVHVDIEAKAAPALAAILPAQQAASLGDVASIEHHLQTIASALDLMNQTLDRMPERCDPYIYYHRVRPYLYGWKDQPALSQGLIYDGVEEYQNHPQQFRGETGAQSGIIPSLDAALGVVHQQDPLRIFLREMRDYMPPAHRAFLESVEAGPSIRQFTRAQGTTHPSLINLHSRCLQHIERFRSRHFQYAARYIHQQHVRSRSNPNNVGTGGTPFMPYLKKHLDETAAHRVDQAPSTSL